MKICWDNLDRLSIGSRRGNFVVDNKWRYYELDSCATCGNSFLGHYPDSKYCTEECKKNNEDYKKYIYELKSNAIKQYNPNWRGGYRSNDIPTYDLYVSKLEPIEQCRRNKQDQNILEIRCTYCGKWFIPNRREVLSRVKGINYNDQARLYCSNPCKLECPIYLQKKYPKGHTKKRKKYNNLPREVQPELRQLVFKRDLYQCQKCGSTESLHCHHIDPVKLNPIESADVDNCITLCKKCHIEVHKIKGCGYLELANCA